MDCGPTRLRMVAKHYGRNFKLQTLRQFCEINPKSKKSAPIWREQEPQYAWTGGSETPERAEKPDSRYLPIE